VSREPRAQRFLFNPAQFINDEAVQGMSLEARGAYIALFCAAYDQQEPGVLPADPRNLAFLARCTPEEWSRVTSQVTCAFDTVTRPGKWIQQGMVRSFHMSNSERDNWRKRTQDQRKRERDVTVDKSVSHGTVSVPVSVSVCRESKHTRAPRSVPNGPTNDWSEAFHEHVWNLRPRRGAPGPVAGESKPAALKAWMKLMPKDPAAMSGVMNRILDALEHDRAQYREAGTEASKIPHLSTYLNQERFLDSPNAVDGPSSPERDGVGLFVHTKP
jgi:uncharacterized protein YdaU (DUF1376 family)